MTLQAGTRLEHYEILSEIGAGGMGEVYRARDTKLGRDVAIKFLPAAFTADPERLARFEREARTLASLNTPTSRRPTASKKETASARWCLSSSRARRSTGGWARGSGLGISETLRSRGEIAAALDAAHEKGSYIAI
jgi:eukaryotic-like serine/threonine-protein kinase